LSNFNQTSDSLDLRGVPFSAGATATAVVSGSTSTLVVTDGANTYRFKLAGTHGAYHVTSDGHGGTLINDPRRRADDIALSSAQAAFAQAYSLLTDPATSNFFGAIDSFGVSGGVQSGGQLGLAAGHKPHA
jgi:hypothetical protein